MTKNTYAFAPCKINLGLNVTEKRNDGFHNIETVFYPVSLYDIIEIEELESGETYFETSGLEIPGDKKDNLIFKALELMKKDFSLPEMKIHLHKVIPMGAGLGGGSSDASNFIKLVNKEFCLGMSEEQMMNYARQLGSDCAFFIQDQPQFAFGKGDQFETIDLDLSLFKIVIVKPEIHVGTKEAYSGVKVEKPEFSLKKIQDLKLQDWKNVVKNDFEDSVFKLYPQIAEIKDKLYDSGALYASMSGSGSSVFGLFKSVPKELPECFEGMFYCQMSLI